MKCGHKTLNDHSRLFDGTERWWRCSHCGHEGPWADGWVYLGNIECTKCGYARVDSVACPTCAPGQMVHTASPPPQPRPKREPAWQRKARLAGWTPPQLPPDPPAAPRVTHLERGEVHVRVSRETHCAMQQLYQHHGSDQLALISAMHKLLGDDAAECVLSANVIAASPRVVVDPTLQGKHAVVVSQAASFGVSLPRCRFCHQPWLPPTGVNVDEAYCQACSPERRAKAAAVFANDGKREVLVGGKYLIRVPNGASTPQPPNAATTTPATAPSTEPATHVATGNQNATTATPRPSQ